jgi:P-loop Domain of unknown function (DUF2791)
MTADGTVALRRTIEALRAGVPNRDAVRELGTSQAHIEEEFAKLLDAVQAQDGNRGLLVDGGFGTGKSHLLEYLQHVALDRRFVATKVVISKETPLHDPVKVFRAAAAGAVVPDRRGSAIGELARGLDFDSTAFRELERWVNSDEADLNERFGATLYLYRDLHKSDQEFAERIVRFWSGDPIGVGEIKRKLREAGEAASWALSKVTVRDLALQRFRFAAALAVAAGYRGWVLLFDEVELIGRYSVLQRGKAYGEIARWVQGFDGERVPWLGSVMAITDDFVPAVIEEKNDGEIVPARLRARDEEVLAARAERGMSIIERQRHHLHEPTQELLDRTFQKLRRLHSAAYGWQAPELNREFGGGARKMRQYVRAWINEWDLRRLDPSYRPVIEIEELRSEYSEDTDLERASEDEAEADVDSEVE